MTADELKDKKRKYDMARYRANREKMREQKRLYDENNREKRLEQKREYYRKNIEKSKKQKKILYENNKKDILEKQKIYRSNNLEKLREYGRTNNAKNRNKWENFLIKNGHVNCEMCGENFSDCLSVIDYHHLDPSKKDANVGRIISRMFKQENIDKFVEESSKCVRLCSNCHRRVHRGASLKI
jgi:hypothetical protein